MTDRSRVPHPRPAGLRAVLAALGVVVVLALPSLVLLADARGAPTVPSTPVVGGVHGPTEVGTGQRASYTVTARGGPAFAPNGTQTGILAYKASVAATNTSGAILSPPSGVLVNQSVTLSFIAPNLTESLTIFVLVTSSVSGLNSTNVSTNFSYPISIVQPYHLAATLVVAAAESVGSFAITVTLDGQPVGTVTVPTLTAGSNYPVSFDYVAVGLAPGWHTFAMNVAPEHGLVTFTGGSEAFQQAFYVAGPPPDNTPWYLAGAAALVVALFILTARVGARRGGKSKK